jgi:hypothetical protein
MSDQSQDKVGHTAGPWMRGGFNEWFPSSDGESCTITWMNIGKAGEPAPVAILVSTETDDATPELAANAHLITAAPDMLAALKGVVAVADRKTNEFDAARAAIAKAEGRSA